MSRAATLCDAWAARRLGRGSVGLCAECADVRCEEQGRKEGDTRVHWSIVGSGSSSGKWIRLKLARKATRVRLLHTYVSSFSVSS